MEAEELERTRPERERQAQMAAAKAEYMAARQQFTDAVNAVRSMDQFQGQTRAYPTQEDVEGWKAADFREGARLFRGLLPVEAVP